MREMRIYGTVCPNCKRSIELGKVELERSAPLAELRRALAEQGWQGEAVKCPVCKVGNLCGPDDLIFF